MCPLILINFILMWTCQLESREFRQVSTSGKNVTIDVQVTSVDLLPN